MDLPITQQAIIRWANEKYGEYCIRPGHSLDFDPGTVDGYAYSNYGYMLLGQIIEALSGIPYEQYIQERLLTPLGIRRMRLGRTLLQSKHSDEVLYHADISVDDNGDVNYHQGLYNNVVTAGAPINTMLQYGGYFSMENMAAHGGWLGTAVDLVRYACSFDNPNYPILSSGSIRTIFDKHKYGVVDPKFDDYYGCGWYIRPAGQLKRQSHGGGFSGTSTLVDRWTDSQTGDLLTMAILLNKNDGTSSWNLHSTLRDVASSIAAWPTTDFWDYYF